MTSPSQPTASNFHDNAAHPTPTPPPLPPRYSSADYSARPDPSIAAMASHDPRSSSMQSLVPDPASETTGRRKLLLVFIHGFFGDETSFRSFPAHVHNLVAITLAESHVVHTKIYPKYRSRYALEVARDNFSQWLAPHETPWTDVILLGHSMGGLLCADIALLFHHRIVGIINFDVPLLGMHPGIVKAGLGSIFKPWPAPEERPMEGSDGTRPSRMDSLLNPKPSDPNYNPSFYNDVNLPVRKGWENALHFINKHSNGLIKASKGLVKSHLEFGGAMADYRELKARYARVRALEEDDESKRRSGNPETRHPPRIRFVNYYTTSTGRPKKPKSPKSPSPSRPPSRGLQQPDDNTSALVSESHLPLASKPEEIAGTASPRISVSEHRGDHVVPVSPEEPLSATSPQQESQYQSFSPSTECGANASGTESGITSPGAEHERNSPAPSTEANLLTSNLESILREIPPMPEEPPFVDLSEFPDKAQRKAAEKELSQAQKEYERAVKARNQVIKERTKLEEKQRKHKEKEQKQTQKAAPKEEKTDSGHESDILDADFQNMQIDAPRTNVKGEIQTPYGNYDFSRSAILSQAHPDELVDASSYTDSTYTLTTVNSTATNPSHPATPSADAEPSAQKKKKRLKKFCMLPPKDATGNKDPTWVRVFMQDVDEVIAHTTLFFLNDTYEQLVGDVGARIEDWVNEAQSARLVREMQGLE